MLHKNVKLLILFNFFTDFRFYVPVAILYFQQVTGSFTLGMSVFSVIFLSAALFEIPTGVFSDRIGRKNTVIIGASIFTLAHILYALGVAPLLFLGAVLEGIGRSFYSGNNNALLHDTLRETKQQDAYEEFLGKANSMFQFAAAFAAIIGAFAATISFSLVMWLSVIPQLVCLFLAFQMQEPKVFTKESANIFDHLRTALKKFKHSKKLQMIGIASMIHSGVGDSSYEFQIAFYGLVWPVWALGIARTVSNFAAAFGFMISGKVIKKLTPIKTLLTEGVLAPTVRVLTLVFITPLSPIILACMSFFYGLSYVSSTTLQHKEFTNEQRATMESLVSLGGSLVNAVSSFGLGVLADKWGVVVALIFAQTVMLLINFFYISVYKEYKLS